MKKMKDKQNINKIPKSICFDPDILERISTVQGRLSRSKYICVALDEIIARDEKKLGIV